MTWAGAFFTAKTLELYFGPLWLSVGWSGVQAGWDKGED